MPPQMEAFFQGIASGGVVVLGSLFRDSPVAENRSDGTWLPE